MHKSYLYEASEILIHMKLFKFLLSISIILSITSCSSRETKVKIDKISSLGAKISIVEAENDRADNGIYVTLFNESGDDIYSDSMVVFVNDLAVKVEHRQGLYYTDESSYNLSPIPVSDLYKVELQLADGKRYFLGSVNALADRKLAKIFYNELGELNKNTVINWIGLTDANELEVSSSAKVKSSEPNIESYEERNELTKKIKENGTFIFPKSKYVDSNSTITNLRLRFRIKKLGTVNPELLDKSEISIGTTLEKDISFREKK